MFSKKHFAIVSNLRFNSRTNFMFSWVEHEKRFITSGLGHSLGAPARRHRPRQWSDCENMPTDPAVGAPTQRVRRIHWSDYGKTTLGSAFARRCCPKVHFLTLHLIWICHAFFPYQSHSLDGLVHLTLIRLSDKSETWKSRRQLHNRLCNLISNSTVVFHYFQPSFSERSIITPDITLLCGTTECFFDLPFSQ